MRLVHSADTFLTLTGLNRAWRCVSGPQGASDAFDRGSPTVSLTEFPSAREDGLRQCGDGENCDPGGHGSRAVGGATD